MKLERYLEIISEDTAATGRLFLSVRAVRARLDQIWYFGTEERADLLVVDTKTLAGRLARARALESGRRFVVLSDVAPPEGGAWLPRRFADDDIVAMLNDSGTKDAARIEQPRIEHRSSDFFADLDDAPLQLDASVEALDRMLEENTPRFKPPPGIDEAEALLRQDADTAALKQVAALRLDDRTAVEYTGDGSARSSARAQEKASPGNVGETLSSPNIDPTFRRAEAARNASYSLREFLATDLLGGAASIALDGAPVLMLDPKQREYRAEGDLTALVPYFTQPLRFGDWRVLTTPELADWRARVAPQSYDRLLWYFALVHGNGRLAPHLDPGGTYRLVRWFEIARELPRQYRISAAMLKPARLHEICAASGTAMEEVFDVVSAYDAIGYVTWQARERLRPPSANPGSSNS
jgi:hypothetical protein